MSGTLVSDSLAAGAFALGASVLNAVAKAFANSSMSLSQVVQPVLTRKAFAAMSPSTPMAVSTWDALTLPDAQADPAETATPARSRFIINTRASRPGTAKHTVFGNLGTPLPKIVASAQASMM